MPFNQSLGRGTSLSYYFAFDVHAVEKSSTQITDQTTFLITDQCSHGSKDTKSKVHYGFHDLWSLLILDLITGLPSDALVNE